MKQYELIIFDWDGTLMDSVGKIVIAVQAMARDVSLNDVTITVPTESAIRDVIGLSLDKSMRVLFPQCLDKDYVELVAAYKRQFSSMSQVPSPLFDTADTLLTRLAALNYRLAVATGKGRIGLDRVLNETGLRSLFGTTRSSDETQSKPHPQMLNEILAELNVASNRALMVGDSIHDLAMANAAGVDAIGVSYGAHSRERLQSARPKAVIDSPLELLLHL